ncbi:tetratricopeptide repeat protein [bacterium]|nr:tetratricopeptide repeat protein [bacterium]
MKVSLNSRWIRIAAAALAILILAAGWAWRTWYAAPVGPEPVEGSPQSIVKTVDRGMSEEQLQMFRDRIVTIEATVNDNEANGTRDISVILSLANLYYEMGELDTAATWYENILKTNPNDAPALENLGQDLIEQGDYSGAEAAWRKALDIEAYEPIYLKLADLIDERFPERTAQVQGVLETAIANLGQTPGLLTRLGQWYASQGKLDEAISHYEVAHQLAPKDESIAAELEALKRERSRKTK